MARPEQVMERLELPTQLPYDFLKRITNDFAEDRKISGNSLFGTLYKGYFPDEDLLMAVQIPQENGPIPAEKISKRMLENIMSVKHTNTVNLVGFCMDTETRLVEYNNRYIKTDVHLTLLCYEYIPMGSLQDNMFGKKEAEGVSPAKPNIDWDTRFKIIKGICAGLCYLHTLDIPIIHMDLKPENILLDSNMEPKIADFLLFELGHEQARLCTRTVAGSYAYMAPEYLYRGEVTTQTDIYSLGLMILEITTGEKNCPENNQPSARAFIEKVQKNWRPENILSMYSSLDPVGRGQVNKCIGIGLECVNMDPILRPSIEEIVDMLSRE